MPATYPTSDVNTPVSRPPTHRAMLGSYTDLRAKVDATFTGGLVIDDENMRRLQEARKRAESKRTMGPDNSAFSKATQSRWSTGFSLARMFSPMLALLRARRS
jgi:hypothetical protein